MIRLRAILHCASKVAEPELAVFDEFKLLSQWWVDGWVGGWLGNVGIRLISAQLELEIG